MLLTDVHTHTKFSTDGKDDMETMVAEAKKLNIAYYGISEHFDYDYLVGGLTFGGKPAKYTDAKAYFSFGRKLQEREKGIKILLGCEYGFTPNEKALPYYKEVIEKYHPDFVVNSVHTNARADYYYKEAYEGLTKQQAYREYFSLVLKSVKADYPFDIVGHLGYVARYAPYEDKRLRYEDFKAEIDEILTEIINRGKILEVNSSARGAGSEFLPDTDILKRYFELGGRKISFASDAHFTSRIMEKRDLVVKALKEIGFTFITVPVKGEHLKIEI